MKKLITTLLLLTITIAYPQSIELDHPDLIKPLLKEFQYEARKRGLFIDGHISKHLGGILVVTEEEIERLYKSRNGEECDCLGIMGNKTLYDLYDYSYNIPHVYLKENTIQHPQGLRMVLFHELGHLFGMGHTAGIMSKGLSIHQTYTKEEWKTYLDFFFEELRHTDPKKYKKRRDNTFH